MGKLKETDIFLNRNPYLTVLAFIKFCSLVPGLMKGGRDIQLVGVRGENPHMKPVMLHLLGGRLQNL